MRKQGKIENNYKTLTHFRIINSREDWGYIVLGTTDLAINGHEKDIGKYGKVRKGYRKVRKTGKYRNIGK